MASTDLKAASRAVATSMAADQGSRRLLESVGFRHTRTVHLEQADPPRGAENGEVVYERIDQLPGGDRCCG